MTLHLVLLAAAVGACGAAVLAVAAGAVLVPARARTAQGPRLEDPPQASILGWAPAVPLAVLALTLAVRALTTGRVPLANLHEVMIGVATATLAAHLALTRGVAALAVAACGVAAVLGAIALSLPVPPEPLVPALQSPLLLGVHVGSAVVAYAAATVASLAAGGELLVSALGPQRAARFPSAARFRSISHRAVLVALPLLTTAIALGSVWANLAWRSYWSNDPKELSAAATWLILGAYLHAVGRKDRWGRMAPWLALLGFGAVLFTLVGASLLFGGQHSYAQVGG